MATPAQIRANRANARKSTGPRTPGGKARSSRNALKHGFRSASATLADQSAVRQLLDEFLGDLRPDSPTEIACVHRMAVAVAHLRVLETLESGICRKHDALTALKKAQTLIRYRAKPQRAFYAALSRWTALLDQRKEKIARTNPISPPPDRREAQGEFCTNEPNFRR